jgi:TolB-like protein/Flp pilus assembly protein TadD
MVVLVLAVGYFAFDKFVLEPARVAEIVEETAEHARTEALVESFGDKSIAVLPFVNMSADPEQEYFSEGVSEELLNLLSKIPELRVISRSSAFSFKGKHIAIPEVAEKLNVAHILEGSVRKDGSRVRITAQLIEAHSDTHLWSETYDREFSDVFQIQDNIAASVVKELQVVMLGEAPKMVEVNPEAYSHYLQGHHFRRSRGQENLEKSVKEFQKALELEPEYALAWVGLARAIGAQTSFNFRDLKEGTEAGREAIQQALALDSSLPEAHVSMSGLKAMRDWDWEGAFESFRLAESHDSDDPLVLACKADLAEFTGQFSLGIEQRRKLLESDPLNAIGRIYLAFTLMRTGRFDEAESEIRLAHDLDPQLWWHHRNMGWTLLLMGRPELALQEFEKEPQLRARLHGRSMALHSLNRRAESNEALEALIAKQAKDSDSAFQIAEVHAWRDESDMAFHWLEQARKQRSTWLPFIRRSVFLFNLEGDSRWEPFLETIGLSSSQTAALSFD